MLDFLASLASSASDAVKLAFKAVLRLFGQQPGGPTSRPGGPGGMVIQSVPDFQERTGPTSDLEAAPAPVSREPELEAPFSPAPARPFPAAAAPEPPASGAPGPEAPSSPAPASAGPSAPGPAAPAPEASAPGTATAEPQMTAAEPDAAAGAEREATAGAAPDEGPTPEPKPVLLGASAPNRARPGDVILAQFTAYVEGFEEQARRELEPEGTSTRVKLGVETDCRWPVGTRVTARCSVKGFAMEPISETFVWDGECRTVSFDIEVPADAQPRSAVLLMEAFVHDRGDAPDAVQVGRLRMPLEIGDVADDEEPRQRVEAETPRTAFASYASEDRVDVLERVSSIERSAGLKVFMDVIDLRMGDRWETELSKEIAASDRFLLFWSEHAAGKKWVTWEWQQALNAKGEDALELHLIRTTPIEMIPERLRHFHFNDIYLQAIDAELYRLERAAREAAAKTPPS